MLVHSIKAKFGDLSKINRIHVNLVGYHCLENERRKDLPRINKKRLLKYPMNE